MKRYIFLLLLIPSLAFSQEKGFGHGNQSRAKPVPTTSDAKNKTGALSFIEADSLIRVGVGESSQPLGSSLGVVSTDTVNVNVINEFTSGSGVEFIADVRVTQSASQQFTVSDGTDSTVIAPDSLNVNDELVKKQNGNVGIGTATPNSALHILNAIGPQFIITDTDKADSCTFDVDGNGDLFINPTGNDVTIQNILKANIVGVSSGAPYLYLYNTSNEDTDGGSESYILIEGDKGDGTNHDMVRIYGQHDGTGDDFKADFIVQNNDGDDADGALTERLRIASDGLMTITGDLQFRNGDFATTRVINLSAIAGETTLTDSLPAGWVIENIIVKNTTANEITNLDFGFSDAGGEIVAASNFLASDESSLTILQRIDDFDAADTIYISSGNWNSASLTIYIKMSRFF